MERAPDGPLAPDQPSLVITSGVSSRQTRPLDRGVVVVGGGPRCDIRLSTPKASELNCIIARTQDGYRIRNYADRPSALLNGRPIRKALLRDGDALEIAGIGFRVHLPVEALAPAEPDAGRQGLHKLERSRR